MSYRTPVDSGASASYQSGMAKNSRVPSAVGSIPVVGDLVKTAEGQAQWMQELVEQNARLLGQLPTTIKTFNDSLETFNLTVQRLDRVVTRLDAVTTQLTGPLEQVMPQLNRITSVLDPKTLADLPAALDSLRREALPALRAATDTQKQVALLTAMVERVLGIVGELPWTGLVRRFAARPEAPGDDATE